MSNPSYPDDCPSPDFDPVRQPMPTDNVFLDYIAWQMYIVAAKRNGISDPFRWAALHRGAQNHWREIAFDKVTMWARDDAETVAAVRRGVIDSPKTMPATIVGSGALAGM